MKNASKKLLVSVVVLIIAVSLAITSTFAWFTMSGTPKIEGFNVNVTTSDGLLISASGDAGSFKSTLTAAEIAAANDDFASLELTAVTSADGIAFETMDGGTDTGSYFDFELYFKSATQQTVRLNDTINTYVTSIPTTGISRIQAWEPIDANEYGVHDAIATGDDILADAQNAARLSFINGDTAKVWYPNSDIGYNKDSLATPKNLALDYQNYLLYPAEVGSDTAAIAAIAAVFALPAADIFTEGLITLQPDELNGGYSATLKVSIWIEGWDGDCFNSIFADQLTVALQFAGEVVNKTSLSTAITAADENALTAVSVNGSDVATTAQWVTSTVMTSYTDAIALADAVFDNAIASKSQVDSAVTALAQATDTFNGAKLPGTM